MLFLHRKGLEDYDSAQKTYAYTTGALGTVVSTVNYVYGNTEWGDLLTTYNGKSITYDTFGNPLSDGTWNYTWIHGRQLASMSKSGTTWNFTYDANGMRKTKTVDSLTYTYIYNGGQLTQMTRSDGNTQVFTYYQMCGPFEGVDPNAYCMYRSLY